MINEAMSDFKPLTLEHRTPDASAAASPHPFGTRRLKAVKFAFGNDNRDIQLVETKVLVEALILLLIIAASVCCVVESQESAFSLARAVFATFRARAGLCHTSSW